MATLIVNGVTVTVSVGTPPSRVTREVGDYTPAFDGSDRGVIVTRKRTWTVTTTPMTQATANTLETALLAAPPIACSGDILGGSVNVRGTLVGYEYMYAAGGLRVVMTMTLTEV